MHLVLPLALLGHCRPAVGSRRRLLPLRAALVAALRAALVTALVTALRAALVAALLGAAVAAVPPPAAALVAHIPPPGAGGTLLAAPRRLWLAPLPLLLAPLRRRAALATASATAVPRLRVQRTDPERLEVDLLLDPLADLERLARTCVLLLRGTGSGGNRRASG